ncbi:hypothetical protein V1264_007550 [Littorina saxatilis]|uniref:Uncharacterized protein n=1 Tax=Littorina saxatilis TaxID=31220 RepID=A0AAN9AWN4_9CAEN
MARTKQTARQGAAGEGSKEASKEAVPPTPPGKVSGASGVQTPIGATAPATPSGSVGSTGGKKGGASLADFEATPVSTASKMKKRKKKADPTKVSNMEDLLQESNESVKEMGESLQKIGQLEEEEVTEAVPLKALQKKTPARKQQASKTIGPHHSFLKDRQTFPLNQLQTTLGAQILPNNSNMLDFTGCSQVTDAVLACMRDLPFNVRDSVTGLNLTGCHFITDAGVIAVADIFHNLKKLFLSGCCKVTEASMVEIAEKCPYLENLYIAGTSVSILPRKLSELDVVSDCTPLVSPLSSEAGFFPKASATMTKVCVIRREEETTMSMLSLLQGEKDVVATSPVNFKPNFSLSKDTLVNVTECNQVSSRK